MSSKDEDKRRVQEVFNTSFCGEALYNVENKTHLYLLVSGLVINWRIFTISQNLHADNTILKIVIKPQVKCTTN